MYESSGYIKINTAYKSYIAALPKKALLYFIFFDIVIILMIIIFQRPGIIYIICTSVSIFVCMLLLGGPYILLLKGYSSLQKQSNESVFKEYIKLDRDKSTFKSHRDFSSEKEITFKHL